ncbi:hypothetical protein PR048_000071 [Dryococelus australis]|uniref:Uncharacterized protein n=1 Tax=Dryococelus australis TaxID=614101 RepID=A0ABQ9IDL7_9NEOP|nr:hypothetical protein PR048_000071 [Dryococelus australis]
MKLGLCTQDMEVYHEHESSRDRYHTRPPPRRHRAQSPAGPPDFRKWESCRAMPLVGGSSRGSPVSPAPSSQRYSIFTSITLISSRDLAIDKHYLLVKAKRVRGSSLEHAGQQENTNEELSGYHTKGCLHNSQSRLALRHMIRLHSPNWSPRLVVFSVMSIQGEGWCQTNMAPASEKCPHRFCLHPHSLTLETRMHFRLKREFLSKNPLHPLHPSSHYQRSNTTGMKGQGKQEIPEKTRQPLASSGAIPTCENSGTTAPGIEAGLPRLSALTIIFFRLLNFGTAAVEWLACSLPTKANRVRSPGLGHFRIFACGNRASRCRWSVGFLGDLLFPPPLHYGAVLYSSRFTLIGSRDLCVDPSFSGRGKRENPEKTHRPMASSGTIPTYENPVTRPGIEPGSPWWGGERANRAATAATAAPYTIRYSSLIGRRVLRNLPYWPGLLAVIRELRSDMTLAADAISVARAGGVREISGDSTSVLSYVLWQDSALVGCGTIGR